MTEWTAKNVILFVRFLQPSLLFSMTKGRLFSVMEVGLTIVLKIAVALMWLVPDQRLERRASPGAAPA